MNSEATRAAGESRRVPTVYAELFAFLRAPVPVSMKRPIDRHIVKELLLLIALDLALAAMMSGAFYWYDAISLMPDPSDSAQSVPSGSFPVLPLDSSDWMDTTPLWTVVLLVVGAAPLLEEWMFRGWLVGTRRALAIFASLLVLIGAVSLIRFGIDPAYPVRIVAILGLAILWVVGVVAYRPSGLRNARPEWFDRCFPAIFWMSALGFALMHAFNYDEPYDWLVLPLLIPQLVGGAILGFARLRYGLWASILLHAAFNGLLVLIYMLY